MRRTALAFVAGVLCTVAAAAAAPAAADSPSLVRSAERIATALERANTLAERRCR